MTTKKTKIVKILQALHLFIFFIGVGIILILHTITENFWDFLRLPMFLKDIDPFLGSTWPTSLHVYQSILIFTLLLSLTDALGLFFYKKILWRYVSDISSFLGLLIIWPTTLFFIFTLATAKQLSIQNINTIIAYFIFTFSIFILDLVTWFVDEESVIKLPRMKK